MMTLDFSGSSFFPNSIELAFAVNLTRKKQEVQKQLSGNTFQWQISKQIIYQP